MEQHTHVRDIPARSELREVHKFQTHRTIEQSAPIRTASERISRDRCEKFELTYNLLTLMFPNST